MGTENDPSVLLAPTESFVITVTRVRRGRVTAKEYVCIGEKPKLEKYSNEKTDETERLYEYRDIEKDAVLETQIFRQSVEAISLSEIIKAVNGL